MDVEFCQMLFLYMIPFELILYVVQGMNGGNFFIWMPNCFSTICIKTNFSIELLLCLCWNVLTIYYIYIYTFSSHTLNYCCFIIHLEITERAFSNYILIQNYFSSFLFSYPFRHSLLTYAKLFVIWIWILYVSLGWFLS